MRKIIHFIIVLIMVIVFAACGTQQEQTVTEDQPEAVQESTADVPQEDEDTQAEESVTVPEGMKHTSILLMGSKERDFSKQDQPAYSLTHILITLDPEKRTIKFTTFPYNLAVDVSTDNGTETMQLQFVSSTVGEQGAVEALEQNFGIDIDYYVVMNMMGVIDVVDALEGVEVDVGELSVNETGEHIAQMLGLVWEEIKSTGRQVLSGLQTAGFFNDTYNNLSQDNWLEEEELIFRQRHPAIINAVIAAVQLAGLSGEDLAAIAQNISGNYITDIPQDEWQLIADTALYCLENDAQYLHVPEVIDTLEHDGSPPMVYDKEKDTAAVQQFTGE